ncbi:MAG: hypothetical protein HYT64_02515 [Candidatus Yanofskybacteria bacterium]|nr:hypothetical protein [Candidatus Yanofskybacteria bacterium]
MKRVDEYLENQVNKFNKLFGANLSIPEVVIFNSRSEINRHKNQETEGWFVGWNEDGIIYILNESKFETESSHPKSDFEKVLTHELLHQYYFQMAGWDKPAWLNEGFCLYFAGQEKQSPSEEEKLLLENYANHWDSKGYKIAYFWTVYLIQNFSVETMVDVIKQVGLLEKDPAVFESKFNELFYSYFKFYPIKDSLILKLKVI